MKGKFFMISNFSCKNFRNVNVDSVKFNKINVFIGPNNVGKTNFIKALTFLPSILNCTDRTLHSAFLSTVAANGWERIRNFDADPNDRIDLKWNLTVDGRPVIYTLAFKVGHNVEDCHIVLEELSSTTTEPP